MVGSAAAGRGPREGASAERAIFEVAAAGEDFEVLEAAVVETGLDALPDGDAQPEIGATDAAASNGVIHVVDGVLLP